MSTNGHRVIAYYEGISDVDDLLRCAREQSITHVLVCLFHLGYGDKVNNTHPRAILNNPTPPIDPGGPFWTEVVPELKRRGVTVMGSLGGGGVQDFEHLFGAYDVFYPILVTTIRALGLQGMDLDIEEPSITTANVKRLVGDLRRDLPDDFLLSSAPVASALVEQSLSMTPLVDYNALIGSFDWYNLQFYNGWGTIDPGQASPPQTPDYEDVVQACGEDMVSKLVAGVLTEGGSGDLRSLAVQLRDLAEKYEDFGGADGWKFQGAVVDGKVDPVKWFEVVNEQVRGAAVVRK